MYSTKLVRVGIFILLLVVVVVFTGCGGTTLPIDETKITNIIHGFYQAMIDLDWDTARSYCVYGSEVYQEIVALEQCCDLYGSYECDIPDSATVTNINPIIINGDYAEAHVYLTMVAGFEEFNSELWLYLQKIGNDWLLYLTEPV